MPDAADHHLSVMDRDLPGLGPALDGQGVVWFRFDAPAGDMPPRSWRADLEPVLRAFASRTTAEDVLVAAGELIANAIEHGGGVARLHVEGRRGCVLVEVCDRSPELVARSRPDAGHRGFGLPMVTSLADGWGWSPTEEGKSVWAWFDVKGDRDA